MAGSSGLGYDLDHMESLKEDYLKKIRTDSAYPQYRQGVMIITVLSYIAVAIVAIFSVYLITKGAAGVTVGAAQLVGCAIMGLLVIPFQRQAMLMAADMVDSTLDRNSKSKS